MNNQPKWQGKLPEPVAADYRQIIRYFNDKVGSWDLDYNNFPTMTKLGSRIIEEMKQDNVPLCYFVWTYAEVKELFYSSMEHRSKAYWNCDTSGCWRRKAKAYIAFNNKLNALLPTNCGAPELPFPFEHRIGFTEDGQVVFGNIDDEELTDELLFDLEELDF